MPGRTKITCSRCGGESVVTTGTLRWDFEEQRYYASSVDIDDFYCDDCDEEVTVIVEEIKDDPISGRRQASGPTRFS